MEKKSTERTIGVSRKELFYYLFFGILFASKGVGMSEGETLFTLCLLAAILCLFVKLCMTEHTIKEWIVMGALVLLGVLIYLSSGEKAALFAILVIIGMKDIPLKRLFTVCLAIWGVTFSLSMCLGLTHIRDGVVVVHEKLGLGPIIRWSLGYTHPNVLHVSWFILAALILYVCDFKGKKLWAASAILFAGNLVIFLYSISYTGVLLTTGFLALNIYLSARKKLILPEKILLECIMPVCVIFPLAGPFVTSGKVFAFFNNLLSYRFELVYNIFMENPVTLIGKGFVNRGGGKLTLDSSYAYLLMYYGTIAFVLFTAGYFFLIHNLVKENRKKELALVIGIVVAGITEQFLFNLSFKNLSFILLGDFLFLNVLRPRKNGGFWNRSFVILPGGDRKILLPDLRGRKAVMAERIAEHKKLLTACVAASALLSAVVCAATVRLPDSVFVERWQTDYRNEEEEKTLDLNEVPEDFNSMVIGYSGPDMGMYEFTGNIISLEYLRDIVAAGILAAGVVLICAYGSAFLVPVKNRRKRN